ncbi:hypothetical protein NC651_029754 [Populus alba x Populus x berolinensis]|nr:hypothetical protein NC651_029754 [Populus alba x Populus x berolinensis]
MVNLEPFPYRYVSIKSSLRLPDGMTVRMKAANDLIIQVGDSICQLHKRRSHGGKDTLPKIQSEGSEIFEIVVKCSAMDGRSSSFPVNTVKMHN